VAIAAGMNHCLALSSNGTVVAWGDNSLGQQDVPTGLDHVVAVAAGAVHSMALRDDGTVVQWGYPAGDYQPSIPPQPSDTPATNAVFQHPTAGVLTPDGRLLVADQLGLRLFDSSARLQRQAAAYLASDLAGGGAFATAGNALEGWLLLIQNLATYALSGPLGSDDILHALLFGSDPLVDTDSAIAFLNSLATSTDWRPSHVDLGAKALQQIDLLQSRILSAVTNLAKNPNPASLPLVTDSLNRLNLLLASHSQPIPAAVLGSAPGTSQPVQVLLNGYPYVDYSLQSSPDLNTWTNLPGVFRDGSAQGVNSSGGRAKFYRAYHQTP
jgi:hypothetical protein